MDLKYAINNKSRTFNSLLNFFSSIFGQIICIVIQFIVRTFFIYYIGKTYLGIGSLFSNILSMLSLVELGIGNAILYKLYLPISENNQKRISALMLFYRRVYRIIGITILILGICLIPFLKYIIKDIHKIDDLGLNATAIYLMYLFKTVSTYLFFAYKSSIIKANQKQFIISFINYFVIIFGGIVQILCLIFFKNYTLYIFINILEVIFLNIACAIFADRKYPYINQTQLDRLDKKEALDIYKDCLSLSLYKTDAVVLKATDNIVLSMFLGLDYVALYSNYYVFYTTIKTIFDKIYSSIYHSLGNLHSINRTDYAYTIFERMFFISVFIGGVASIGIYICSDELISFWIGSSWVLKQPFSFLLGIEIFTLSLRKLFAKYRASLGLFRQSKLIPLASILINIVLSILLVNKWEISGVIIATIIASWTTLMWADPFIIHKYGFMNKYSIGKFYLKESLYIFVIFISKLVAKTLCNIICIEYKLLQLTIHILISILIPSIFIVLTFNKNHETQYFIQLCISIIKKLNRKQE